MQRIGPTRAAPFGLVLLVSTLTMLAPALTVSAAPIPLAHFDPCFDVDGVTEIDCPAETPVEETPAEEPPAETPPAEVPVENPPATGSDETGESYYYEEEDDEEATSPVVTPPVTGTKPTPTPTPTPSAALVPTQWDAPFYTGDEMSRPNLIALVALAVSAILGIGVLLRLLFVALARRRRLRRAPLKVGGLGDEAAATVLLPAVTEDAHEFTTFDKLFLQGDIKAQHFDPNVGYVDS